MDFYEAYREHRDKFEIIALHDTTAKDFDELDRKLAKTKENLWGGKNLPFPVLLDATGTTLKEFGVFMFPTQVLIDPNGTLVGMVSGTEALEEKLPPLSIATRLARALDRQVFCNVDDTPLSDAVKRLSEAARVPIRLDEDALLKAGIAPGAVVPLTLGGRLSLRSWLNVLLDAPKLTFTRGDEALVITPRAPGQDPPLQDSDPQRRCAKRLDALLGDNVEFDFKEATLADIVKQLERTTGESFILDPAARHADRLNPGTKLSGADAGRPLGEALKELLRPAQLTYLIRDELVLLTPLPAAP